MNKPNRFDNVKLPLLMGFISVISLVVGMRLQESLTSDGYLGQSTSSASKHKAIYEATEHIKSKYYGTLSDSAYTDAVIYEMVDQLDPYSHYFPEAQNKLYNTYIKGVDRGIGIDIESFSDTIYIYDIIKGSSADLSNLEKGDILKAINDIKINDQNLDTVSVITNSQLEKSVTLEVYSPKTQQTSVLELEIDELQIPLLDDYILQEETSNQSISYVRIKRFYSDVFRDFMDIMEKHKNTLGEDVSLLIIDVRDNPGGVVEETVKILNQFFQEKELPILSTQSKVNKAHEYDSNGRSFLKIEKIIILCNGNSASASEILAGSLQDYDKAVLIGEDTYGKGLIQQNYDLSNNASINLSIGEYILPSGRSIYKPIEKDSSYFSLNNKRPLISQKGVNVDVEMASCQSSKKHAGLLRDIILENHLWQQNQDYSDLMIASLQSKDFDVNCATETSEYLKWLYTKRHTRDGQLVSSKKVDPQMKKAIEIILSDDYDRITGYSN